MSSAIVKRINFLGALIAFCLSLSGNAAVEEITLKLKDDPLPKLGRTHCDAEKKITIPLSPKTLSEHDDFRALVHNVTDKKNLQKESCPAKITDNQAGVAAFNKNSRQIELIHLLGGTKGGACTGDGSAGAKLLCIYPDANGSTEVIAVARYTYDTKVAKIDGISDDILAANGVIEFTVLTSGGTAQYMEICYGPAKDGTIEGDKKCPSGFEHVEKEALPKAKLTKNIVNGTEYTIGVRLLDSGNKENKWYVLKNLTPIRVALPLEYYEGAGGELMFSCQSAKNPADWSLFLGLAALLMVVRHRRKLALVKTPLVVLPLLLLMPAEQGRAEFGQMSIGLLGSMYRPDLDSEKPGMFPFYKNFFRKDTKQENGPITPLMGLEFDVHMWDGFGSLQLGMGVGYTYVSGKGLAMATNDRVDPEKQVENYKVSLHMYQLRPQLTYVFNPYVEIFPLVPYVRAAVIGQGYGFRYADHAADTFTNSSGATVKANGFRFGYQGAVGLMLRMNFLEPGAVRSARSGGFFENIYLKGELSYTKIDSFGRPGFQFSPKDVMGSSLPLMWTFGLVFELP